MIKLNIYNICFLLLLILFYFIFKYKKKNIIEGLTEDTNIILVGDSMLENSNYVDEFSTIEYNLKKNHKNVIILANDNSTIENVKSQLHNMPEDYDNKNSYIFLSIGGNDLLNTYKYENNSTEYTFHIDEIFLKYKNLVNYIKERYKCKLVLLNIYYPKSKEYTKYHNIIDIWNNKLTNFSKDNNIETLDVTSILFKENHFTNGIEPSEIGSKLLASNIKNY